ncbi:MAG: succinylglutamate desuccinylase/aspartoacylase family protein [Thermomicrobiales bacterium]
MTQKGNRDVITIGSASAARGHRADGWLELGRRTDNSPLQTPVILVNGAHDGPALWIHGCTHGDEFDGTVAIWRALELVDPRTLRGALIVFPALNTSAFEARQRVSPIDGLDLNRVFPGDPNGSYTRRLAHLTEHLVKEHADFMIDLHGGGNEFSVVYYTLYHAADSEAGRASDRLAKSAGSHLVWASDDVWLRDGLFTRVTKAGIGAMLVECGGEGRLHEQNVRDHERSLVNMMRHLEMIDGEMDVLADDEFVMMKSADFFHCTMGGVVTPLVKLGDEVHQGQPLLQIRDVFGKEVEVVTAPSGPSIVLAIKTYGVTNGGASMGILGVKR